MRIIYILSSTTPYGGASKSFLNLLEIMIQKGIIPLVIVPDNKGLCAQLDKLGVAYRTLFYRFCVYPPTRTFKDWALFLPRLIGRIYANIRGTSQLCSLIKVFQPDLIHSNVSVIDIGYKAAKRMHIPHIWHIREYGDKDFNLHFYPSRQDHLRALKEPLSYSICITIDIAKYNHVYKFSQSRVIYNGIVPISNAKEIITQNERENMFLFVGHIEPAKGVLEMILAFSESCIKMHTPHKLLLAGEITNRNYYNYILSRIRQVHADKYIEFLGQVNNVSEYIQKSKAVIVPSKSEGFGRVMPEAMYLDTLVIAHNTAGSKEQLDNGVRLTGAEIGIRYDNIDELTKYIVLVANNSQDTYAEMRLRAKQTVKQLYSNEHYANLVYEFYNDIVKK